MLDASSKRSSATPCRRCVAQAPGRVNLIGEHTDYNDGFVLPWPSTSRGGGVRPRDDGRVRVVALDFDEEADEFACAGPFERDQERSWPNYIRGMYAALTATGHEILGADLVVAGDVPLGAGLSSSAALEMAVGETLRTSGQIAVTDAELAASASAPRTTSWVPTAGSWIR